MKKKMKESMCGLVGVGLNVIISIITLRHHIFFVSPSSGNLFYYHSTIIIIIKKKKFFYLMFEKVLKTVIKRLIPKQWMAILLMLCIKNHPLKPTTTKKNFSIIVINNSHSHEKIEGNPLKLFATKSFLFLLFHHQQQ